MITTYKSTSIQKCACGKGVVQSMFPSAYLGHICISFTCGDLAWMDKTFMRVY